MDYKKLCGLKKDTKKDRDDLHRQSWCMDFDDAWRSSIPAYDKKEYVLINEVVKAEKDIGNSWKNSRQGIGDCVSHGGAHALDCIMAIQHNYDGYLWEGIAATEALYGLCRVEALGRKSGGWGDGATASGQMKAVKNYGCILRHDYSKETGNSEHDLRIYSSKKAKDWGNYGCGGKDDNGKMDEIARRHPIKAVVYIKTLEEAAAAISNGYALSVCSGYGFTMKRDANGISPRRGSWAHCMAFVGVRYFNGEIQLMIQQSWGISCSGPLPGIDNDQIKGCCWWISAKDAQGMLNARGTYAYSDMPKMCRRKINWLDIGMDWIG